MQKHCVTPKIVDLGDGCKSAMNIKRVSTNHFTFVDEPEKPSIQSSPAVGSEFRNDSMNNLPRPENLSQKGSTSAMDYDTSQNKGNGVQTMNEDSVVDKAMKDHVAMHT